MTPPAWGVPHTHTPPLQTHTHPHPSHQSPGLFSKAPEPRPILPFEKRSKEGQSHGTSETTVTDGFFGTGSSRLLPAIQPRLVSGGALDISSIQDLVSGVLWMGFSGLDTRDTRGGGGIGHGSGPKKGHGQAKVWVCLVWRDGPSSKPSS